MKKLIKINEEFIAKKLKERRKELNLSQLEVSSLCGLANTQISYIEKKQAHPTLSKIDKLAEVYNTPIDYFVNPNFTYDKDKYESYYHKNKEILEIDSKRLGNIFISYRKKIKKSQKEMANIFNITQSVYSTLENGKALDLKVLYYYSQIMNIPMQNFLNEAYIEKDILKNIEKLKIRIEQNNIIKLNDIYNLSTNYNKISNNYLNLLYTSLNDTLEKKGYKSAIDKQDVIFNFIEKLEDNNLN